MLNRFTAAGRLTKPYELRFSPNGKPYGTFSIAVQREFKNAQGEREADFFNCIIWGKIAEVIANFRLDKGALVSVDGRLQSRTYDTDNGKRYVVEVVCDSVQTLSPKGNSLGVEVDDPENPF